MKPALPEFLDLYDSSNSVLVIGGSGFIGSHLVEALLKRSKWTIKIIDEENQKIAHLLDNPRLVLYPCNYFHCEELNELISSSEAVVSLAALCNPSLYMASAKAVIHSNYDHPRRIVDICAAEQKWLIHLSSSEVFGRTVLGEMKRRRIEIEGIDLDESVQLLNEDSAFILGPIHETRWSYAAAKQLFERYIFALGLEEELRWTIIRPFNFIGPRMDYINGVDGQGIPRVLAVFMEKLLRGQKLPLVDGGETKRVFTDIRDAVDAMIAVLTCPTRSQNKVLHIGNPRNEMSIKELAEKILDKAQNLPSYKPAGVEFVDAESFYGKGYADSDRRILDTCLLESLYGWMPKYSLDQTLDLTMSWFAEHYSGQI